MSVTQALAHARKNGYVNGSESTTSAPIDASSRQPPAPVQKGLSGISDSLSSSPLLQPKPHPVGFSSTSTPSSVAPFHSPVRSSPRSLKENLVTPPRTKTADPTTPPHPTPVEAIANGLLNSPHPYHRAKTLASPDNLKSQTRKEIRNLKKRLEKRSLHTLIIGTSPQKDMIAIRSGNGVLTPKGTIAVKTSTGATREYGTHPSGNGRYSVFPVRGVNILPLKGPDLKNELDQYENAKSNGKASRSFEDHLEKYVHKRKESSDPETPSLSSPVQADESSATTERASKQRKVRGAELSPLPFSDLNLSVE